MKLFYSFPFIPTHFHEWPREDVLGPVFSQLEKKYNAACEKIIYSISWMQIRMFCSIFLFVSRKTKLQWNSGKIKNPILEFIELEWIFNFNSRSRFSFYKIAFSSLVFILWCSFTVLNSIEARNHSQVNSERLQPKWEKNLINKEQGMKLKAVIKTNETKVYKTSNIVKENPTSSEDNKTTIMVVCALDGK